MKEMTFGAGTKTAVGTGVIGNEFVQKDVP